MTQVAVDGELFSMAFMTMKDYRNVMQLSGWVVVGDIKVNICKDKIREARETSLCLQVYLCACSGGLAFFLCRAFLVF